MRELKITQTKLDHIQSISSFFKDINKIKKEDQKDDIDLIEASKRGDQRATSILVKKHSRFVVAVAMQYSQNPHLVADLIQVGQIGLLDSIKKFDSTRGFKFISYAVWFIRKEIIQFLKFEIKTVKRNDSVQNNIRKIKKEEEILLNELERMPTAYEISKSLEKNGTLISPEEVEILILSDIEESLDVTLESGASKAELIPSNLEFGAFNHEEAEELASWIEKLPPLERKIIEKCSGINGKAQLDLAEFAREEKRSREWARLLWNRAIFKLTRISLRKN